MEVRFRSFRFSSVWMTLVVLSSIVGCGSDHDVPEANISARGNADGGAASVNDPSGGASSGKLRINYYPEVVIGTTLGDITLRLDSKKAPRTVEHFLENHVDVEFYDGTVFHYVEEGFMVIGGGYTPELEPNEPRGEVLNEADNGLSNLRGTIAMARHPAARNSATCQFFINLADNPSLDHQDAENDANFGYCVFGKVIAGQEVVDRIAKVDVHDIDQFPNTPVEPVVIHSIRRAN